ncbi:hypothetical protein FJ364_05790, partial [Candidatus Dependentiae bacterium]|nr:hypothetical protein [Candidatus Dependentiae bacterium]
MYEIIVDHEPNQTDNDIISEGLFASYKSIIGQRDKSFSVFLKKDSGEIFGGLQAFLDTQSVYIDLMWIEESFR